MATITRPRGAPPAPSPSPSNAPTPWTAPDLPPRTQPLPAVRTGRPKKADLTPRQLVRRQRRRRRRILIGLAIFTIVVDLLVGTGTAYVRWRLSQIKRVDIPSLTPDDPDKPMNVLLVGSDSRDRLTGDIAGQAGKDVVEGQRSDTIMVLHIDPKRQTGALVSIPRDLYVPIAGTTGSDRINSAFSIGGADALIATISQALKIQINHYAEVDFVGLKDIIDAVGGVKMYVPNPARDLHTGLQVGSTGCIKFTGTMGVAWVRSRYYEEFIDGRWQPDNSSDLGRIQRQQDLLRKMAKEAASDAKSNPLALNRLIGIGVANLTIDSALSTEDLTRLGKRLGNLDPDSLDMFTLPASNADINGAAVLILKDAEAQPIIDRINGVTNPAPAPTTTVPAGPTPAQVRVRVLNGVGVTGAAAKAGTAFTGAGFTVVDLGDADAASYTRTVVRHAPGKLAAAQLVQQSIQGGADLQEDRTLTGADVAVVVGRDYTGLKAGTAGTAGTGGTATAPTTAAVPTTVSAGVAATTSVPATTVRPSC